MVLVAWSAAGCASIATHAPKWSAATQVVKFVSEPSGAAIWLDGKRIGTTPTVFPVPTGRPLIVRFEKDGYAPAAMPLRRTLSGWLAGDAAFALYGLAPNGFGDRPESRARKIAIGAGAAVVAFAVDFANGAAFHLPSRVSATLVPLR